ncbi:MAG: hypothetical protein K2F89_07010, partial [Treponemataceae bacterium]|nr:hypothetical protein [Treponemataceae bacterium]
AEVRGRICCTKFLAAKVRERICCTKFHAAKARGRICCGKFLARTRQVSKNRGLRLPVVQKCSKNVRKLFTTRRMICSLFIFLRGLQ